ncbi:MAG TPA: RIP metalloprotease RseP [Acidobacteriota bacterium]|jgi:regulator of sigma E protease
MAHIIGTNILALIFVLGVMIFVHEFGHYVVAKLLKIRVDVFSLGFGPRLFGFRKGDTDYRVSALPLGGYVKMAGENFDEELTGAEDEFLSRPKSHRMAVAIAGPLMNFLLAIGLLAGNLILGVQIPAYLYEPPIIGAIDPHSPAERAGLRVGDRILSIGNSKTQNWEDVTFATGASARRPLPFRIQRDGKQLTGSITPEPAPDTQLGWIGVGPLFPSIVGSVEPGSPADRAGLKPRDEIIKVKSPTREVFTFSQARALIAENEGKPLEFTIRRGKETLQKTIIPQKIAGDVRIGYVPEPPPLMTKKFGALDAIRESIQRNYRLTLLTFNIVGKILTGDASIRTISGPIEIARYSGEAARRGASIMMEFMAMISLQLGIFNLFPIPILDGGVIFLLLVESLIRRDLSLQVKERIFQIGFIFIILLMGIVLFNDLNKSLTLFK